MPCICSWEEKCEFEWCLDHTVLFSLHLGKKITNLVWEVMSWPRDERIQKQLGQYTGQWILKMRSIFQWYQHTVWWSLIEDHILGTRCQWILNSIHSIFLMSMVLLCTTLVCCLWKSIIFIYYLSVYKQIDISLWPGINPFYVCGVSRRCSTHVTIFIIIIVHHWPIFEELIPFLQVRNNTQHNSKKINIPHLTNNNVQITRKCTS